MGRGVGIDLPVGILHAVGVASRRDGPCHHAAVVFVLVLHRLGPVEMRRLVEVASEDAEASLFLLGPGVSREIPGDLRAAGLLFAFEDEINVGDRSVCEFVPSVGRRAVAVAARQVAGVIHVVGV